MCCPNVSLWAERHTRDCQPKRLEKNLQNLRFGDVPVTPFFSCSAQSSKSHTANGDHYDNAKTKKKCIALAKIAKEWTSRANNKQMTNVNNYLANDFRNSRKHDDEKAELSSEQNFSDQLYKKA